MILLILLALLGLSAIVYTCFRNQIHGWDKVLLRKHEYKDYAAIANRKAPPNVYDLTLPDDSCYMYVDHGEYKKYYLSWVNMGNLEDLWKMLDDGLLSKEDYYREKTHEQALRDNRAWDEMIARAYHENEHMKAQAALPAHTTRDAQWESQRWVTHHIWDAERREAIRALPWKMGKWGGYDERHG
jgi:hypothetical protein